jgi:hypothetical protein
LKWRRSPCVQNFDLAGVEIEFVDLSGVGART